MVIIRENKGIYGEKGDNGRSPLVVPSWCGSGPGGGVTDMLDDNRCVK